MSKELVESTQVMIKSVTKAFAGRFDTFCGQFDILESRMDTLEQVGDTEPSFQQRVWTMLAV